MTDGKRRIDRILIVIFSVCKMKKQIFISYSRYDEEIVFPFINRIERELGPVCWIDKQGIESGSQFENVIVSAIEDSKVVLFMLSDKSIDSKWTQREVLYAEDEGKRIVPVVLDGGKLRKWFKFHFGNVDYIDIRDEAQCEKLLEDMAAWISIKEQGETTLKQCFEFILQQKDEDRLRTLKAIEDMRQVMKNYSFHEVPLERLVGLLIHN